MNILFLLSPLFLWGLNPLIIRKIDGHDSNEMFGTGVGALVMGIAVLFFIGNWSQASALKLFLSFLSGAAWSIGQLGQYVSYRKIGVSKTMPISTGLQILGASVIGVLVYGEWAGTAAKIEGAIAITILIAGVYLISVADKNSSSSSLKEYLPLIFTSIGYWVYSCLPKAIKMDGIQVFAMQMFGSATVALIYAMYKNHHVFVQKQSWENILPGLFFALASLAYIFAARSFGVTTAYIVGQLNVVISTVGSIFFLKEHKHGSALIKTLIGLALIVIGGLTTTFL